MGRNLCHRALKTVCYRRRGRTTRNPVRTGGEPDIRRIAGHEVYDSSAEPADNIRNRHRLHVDASLARGRAALYAFLSVILAVTVLVSILAVWLGRRLTRPLTELTTAARALADGRIEPRRQAPRSPE